MAKGIVFIEEMPEVILDGSGARLSYNSGGDQYLRRYPRHLWRRFLEKSIRQLNEYERAERCQIVPMESRAGH